MEIKRYLTVLNRRKWIILLTFVTVMITVSIGTYFVKPIYEASTTLRVSIAPSGTIDYSELTYADRLINTYVMIATSEPVMGELASQLGRTQLPSIKVAPVANTELMQIKVDSEDPVLARDTANKLASILISRGNQFYSGYGPSQVQILAQQMSQLDAELTQARKDYDTLVATNPGDTVRINALNQSIISRQNIYDQLLQQYEQARIQDAMRSNGISIVEPAVTPVNPAFPKLPLNLALGALLGLVGGLGLALLFENFDTTVYSPDEIETVSGLGPLVQVPSTRLKDKNLFLNGNTPAGEAIRQLRASILQINRETQIRTLLITSARPREGKSTLAVSLAYSLAQSGMKVILVDADMRLPSLHRILNVPNKAGLSLILKEGVRVDPAIQSTNYPGVDLIPSGPVLANPSDLLVTDRMRSLVQTLAERYDMTLIDAPALLAVSDASTLAALVDGAILVVESAHTHKESIEAARKQLEDAKVRVLGVVVNRAQNNPDSTYYLRTKYRR